MNKSIKRGISTILAAAIVACTSSFGVYAKATSVGEAEVGIDANVDIASTSSVLSINDLPECLAHEMLADNQFSARLYERENALDTVLFANKDGSETVYIFNEDVKYINENGKTMDKSNKLYSDIKSKTFLSDYSYVNKENDINTYFPKTLKTDVGVSVEAQGQIIEMYPVSDIGSKVSADDDMYGVYYDDVFGEFTGIRYAPSFSGYKEDIVLEKNVGNKFGFILETGDLVPVLENGVIYFRDENGEDFGLISPTYVYDSFIGDASLEDERHFTYDNKFELTYVSTGKYELVVIVDEEFLSNPATVYPVIVDPSITINSTGSGSSKSILDTPIYNGSGAVGTAGVNSLAVIGYVSSSYGSGRLLMRFPGLMKQSFMSQNYKIDSAALVISECSGGSASSNIYAYNYTGPAWDETTTYSSSAYNGVGSYIDYWWFNYPNSTTRSYNITSAVRSWQLDHSKGNKGIIFKNNTSESDYSKTKTFYTTEGTTKPYLKVNYSLFYGCKGVKTSYGSETNCLAYAFFLDEDTFGRNNAVLQNMAVNPTPLPTALSRTKTEMAKWLKETFGTGNYREVDRYNSPLASNEWLVAMRVGVKPYTVYDGEKYITLYYDYHFWYRANNGKWYNKHGYGLASPPEEVSGNVTNPSASGENSSDGWYMGNTYYYDSNTVYYAVKQ